MLLTTYLSNDQVFSLINRKRLDFPVAEVIKSAILSSVSKDHSSVILDIRGVHFIDSAAFSMLTEVYRVLKNLGHTFSLKNVSEDVKELIDLGICQICVVSNEHLD